MPEIDESDRLLAHGQAALVLVEGVLLVLIEAGIVDKGQVLEAIETAISGKCAMANDEQENRNVATAAIALLSGIENSLLAAQSGGSDSARIIRTANADLPTTSNQITEQVRRVDNLTDKSHRNSVVAEEAPTRRCGHGTGEPHNL